jgi:pyruvate dehydrogenase E1 component alpha subunit/2-oxoisovalerate dehydrogenase E1 component alpha subunit
VDGNDFLAVYGVLRAAVQRARSGEGPTFVECVTYRIGAHSSSDDPTRYRSQEEVDAWVKKDPLHRLRRFLDRIGAWSDAKDEELERELNAEIGAAIEKVEPYGPPERETLFDDVYAELPWHLGEQRAELLRHAPVKSER